MASGDGLILRLRPPLGRLTAGQAEAMADLALAFGNGLVQATNRANLQIRGVRGTGLAALHDGLAGAGLLDPSLSADQEARLNILFAPAAADDPEGPAIARGLREALLSGDAPRLPAKFGFVVDLGAAAPMLAGVSGDIRIERVAGQLQVRADGAEAGAAVAGPGAAVALALALARWFLAAGGVGDDGRGRMRGLLAGGVAVPAGLSGPAPPTPIPSPRGGGEVPAGPVGHAPKARSSEDGATARPQAPPLPPVGRGWGWGAVPDHHDPARPPIGLAYGLIEAAALRAVARAVPAGVAVTPWRALWPLGPTDRALLAGHPGLILTGADPRLHIHACTGTPGCAAAHGATRALADRLAPHLAPGESLHVSGCAKGCAAPGGPVALTLTFTPDGLTAAPATHALLTHLPLPERPHAASL
jgi:precorrin-3B synthase